MQKIVSDTQGAMMIYWVVCGDLTHDDLTGKAIQLQGGGGNQ